MYQHRGQNELQTGGILRHKISSRTQSCVHISTRRPPPPPDTHHPASACSCQMSSRNECANKKRERESGTGDASYWIIWETTTETLHWLSVRSTVYKNNLDGQSRVKYSLSTFSTDSNNNNNSCFVRFFGLGLWKLLSWLLHNAMCSVVLNCFCFKISTFLDVKRLPKLYDYKMMWY